MSRRSGVPQSVVSSPRGGISARLLALLALAGLSSLSLTACGPAGPSKSYQQGWDRAIASPGYDCTTVPRGAASPGDWTKGCMTAENFQRIHSAGGRPTPYSDHILGRSVVSTLPRHQRDYPRCAAPYHLFSRQSFSIPGTGQASRTKVSSPGSTSPGGLPTK